MHGLIKAFSLWRTFLLTCLMFVAGAVFAATPSLSEALGSGRYVLMMRHAEAPGIGDPPGYTMSDCRTQRNLDAAGKRQARATGDWLRRQGIATARVFSSPWCRCKDTAEALRLGSVAVEPSLASFFDSPEQGPPQTLALSEFIAAQLAANSGVPQILVTHHVNIRDFVGVNIGSGDMVLVQVNQNGRYLSHERIALPAASGRNSP